MYVSMVGGFFFLFSPPFFGVCVCMYFVFVVVVAAAVSGFFVF